MIMDFTIMVNSKNKVINSITTISRNLQTGAEKWEGIN